MVACADDDCAVRDDGNVRADGRHHGERAFGPDSRGVWLSLDVFRDDYGIFGGFGERGGGVCGRGGGCADFWSEQVHRRADGGGGGVGGGGGRDGTAGWRFGCVFLPVFYW